MDDKAKIMAVLQQNGINNIDDLASMIASENESPIGTIAKNPQLGNPNLGLGIDPTIAASWVIKVWKLDAALQDMDINDLPTELGGNILNP